MKKLMAATAATLVLAGQATAWAAETKLPLPLPVEPMPAYAVAQYEATPTPASTEAPASTPAAIATPAPAAAGAVVTGVSKLKLSGVLYGVYSYDLSQGSNGKSLGNKNGFDVTRAYVNVEPSWGDDYFARVTVDVARATTTSAGNASINTTGSLVERLKYGYFGADIIKGKLSSKIGLQQTPWISFEEDVWVYRVLSSMAAETFHGLSSSDFGLSFYGKLFDRVEYHSGVFNGETYQKPEANKYKEIDTRVTVTILPADKDPGLRASLYYGYGLKGPAQDSDKVRGIGMISWQDKLFTLGVQYVYKQDGAGGGAKHVIGSGESVFGFVNLPFAPPKMYGSRVLARVDMDDPNTDSASKKDGSTRIIAGLSGRFTDKTSMILDYQSVTPENSAKKPTQGVFAHWEAKF